MLSPYAQVTIAASRQSWRLIATLYMLLDLLRSLFVRRELELDESRYWSAYAAHSLQLADRVNALRIGSHYASRYRSGALGEQDAVQQMRAALDLLT